MARTTVKKDSVKTVNYLNKDFNDFKGNLIEYAKQYFPNTYNDFNEASPGMMFVEMAAYVGDVLSYYVDSQFRESMLAYAEEKRNVYNIAQSFGYKPRTTSAATAVLDVFQTVPALNNKPDTRYSLNVPAGAVIKAPSTATTFRTTEDANFKFSSSFDPMTISTFESDNGVPTKYLLKKKVKAQSGDLITEYFNFNSPEKYSEVRLGNPDVIEILSCTDSDGNKWYEVDSLARDTIFEDMENNVSNDPQSAGDSNLAPYILKLKRVSRRFSTHINENDETVLRFGSGTSDNPDEEIIPNPTNVGSSLPGSPTYLTTAFDPSNFLKTSTFGLAPANTTLTIKYAYGGGIDDNVNQGEIKQITDISFQLQSALLSDSIVQDAKDSVSFSNPRPATGGSSGESVKDVRENALAHFQSQQRAVTKDDYIIRAYSLPAKYGNVAKVSFVQDEQLSRAGMLDNLERVITEEDIGTTVQSLQVNKIPNPLAINMYTLGYDSNRKLRTLTETTKQNLKTYISQYRMITDAVNIKNAYVINIGVNFSILTKVGFNKNDVLLRCVSTVQDFFDIDRWQIGQPVVLSDIAYELSLVDGVASLVPPTEDNPLKNQIVVKNLFDVGQGYSGNIYDMESSLKGGILYPALDPSIFEVKFPNSDIKGKVVGDNLGIVE
jgi:hypothetical protein|tara:strand:+ start:2076 stop:4064 length:1989 start_codon:yes stop_codon:yes gene_type:complete